MKFNKHVQIYKCSGGIHKMTITEEYRQGKTIQEIADKHNLSYSTIRNKLMLQLSKEEWEQLKKRNRQQNLKKQINQSKKQNTSGYFRVTKYKCKTCKDGYAYVYQYYGDNKLKQRITRASIEKLEQAVTEKGLPWLKY